MWWPFSQAHWTAVHTTRRGHCTNLASVKGTGRHDTLYENSRTWILVMTFILKHRGLGLFLVTCFGTFALSMLYRIRLASALGFQNQKAGSLFTGGQACGAPQVLLGHSPLPAQLIAAVTDPHLSILSTLRVPSLPILPATVPLIERRATPLRATCSD